MQQEISPLTVVEKMDSPFYGLLNAFPDARNLVDQLMNLLQHYAKTSTDASVINASDLRHDVQAFEKAVEIFQTGCESEFVRVRDMEEALRSLLYAAKNLVIRSVADVKYSDELKSYLLLTDFEPRDIFNPIVDVCCSFQSLIFDLSMSTH